MCGTRLETAWLYHEIGNCFLILQQFEFAREAARRSLEAAEEAVEWSYQLQSSVLLGVAEGMMYTHIYNFQFLLTLYAGLDLTPSLFRVLPVPSHKFQPL